MQREASHESMLGPHWYCQQTSDHKWCCCSYSQSSPFYGRAILPNVPVNGGQISLLKTYLKTAVATVGHNHMHTHCEANILLDEGAQRSFITQTLADQLGIRYAESESIALSAFGAHSSSNRHLPMAYINIIATNGEHIPVRVLVIDQNRYTTSKPLSAAGPNHTPPKRSSPCPPCDVRQVFWNLAPNWCRSLLGYSEGHSHPWPRPNCCRIKARLPHLWTTTD